MKTRRRTIEIPLGAGTGSQYTATFPFEVKALLAVWNGRSGGVDSLAPGSHHWGQGFWGANGGQFCMCSSSGDALDVSVSRSKANPAALVEIINPDGTVIGSATVGVSYSDGTSTVTLTVQTPFAVGLSVDLSGGGGSGAIEVVASSISLDDLSNVVPTGLSGRPDLVYLLARSQVNSASVIVDSHWMFGAAAYNDGAPEQAAAWAGADYDMDTSRTGRWSSYGKAYGTEGAAVLPPLATTGVVAAWGEDGSLTINRTSSSSTRVYMLAIRGVRARVLSGQTRDDATPITLTPGFPVGGGIVVSVGRPFAPADELSAHDVRSVGLFDKDLTQRALAAADLDSQMATAVATAYRAADVYARISTADRSLVEAMKVTAIAATTVDLQMSVLPAAPDPSGFWAVLTEDDPPELPPSAIADVTVANVGAGRVKVSSAADLAASGATTYVVQRSNTGTSGWQDRSGVLPVQPGANEYEDTAQQGVTRHWRIRAINAAGETNSNAAGPLTTASALQPVITAPLQGAKQLEGEPWSLQADTPGAVAWEWSSNIDGFLGATEDLTGITLSGTDAAAVNHTLKLRVQDVYGDWYETTVGVVSGIGATGGTLIIDGEDLVFSRQRGSTDPIPFTLLGEDGSQAFGVVLTPSDVMYRVDQGAWTPVDVGSVAAGENDYEWTPSPGQISGKLVRLRIKREGYRTRTVYIETYGDTLSMHPAGADASGTTAAAAGQGDRELPVVVTSGAVVRDAEIRFLRAAAYVTHYTGTAPNLTAHLAHPGLSEAVTLGEPWTMVGVAPRDHTGMRLDGDIETLSDLAVPTGEQIGEAVQGALGEYGAVTTATFDERLSEARAAMLDRDLLTPASLTPLATDVAAARTAAQSAAGDAAILAMRITDERATALDRNAVADVATALDAAGFTAQLARMLLKSAVWGGGGGSATRASATTPTFQVTAPGGESLGTITVTTDADGRLLGISASEAG